MTTQKPELRNQWRLITEDLREDVPYVIGRHLARHCNAVAQVRKPQMGEVCCWKCKERDT